jgi:hypothetical protein
MVLFARQNRLLPYNLKNTVCTALHHSEQESTSKGTRTALWWWFIVLGTLSIYLIKNTLT